MDDILEAGGEEKPRFDYVCIGAVVKRLGQDKGKTRQVKTRPGAHDGSVIGEDFPYLGGRTLPRLSQQICTYPLSSSASSLLFWLTDRS
jgi:hypothetical protein